MDVSGLFPVWHVLGNQTNDTNLYSATFNNRIWTTDKRLTTCFIEHIGVQQQIVLFENTFKIITTIIKFVITQNAYVIAHRFSQITIQTHC